MNKILQQICLLVLFASVIQASGGQFNTKRIKPYSQCNTELRVFTENCECTDGYYDDLLSGDCQLCPYPLLNCHTGLPNQQMCENKMVLSLDHYTTQEAIEYIDDYLVNKKKIFELEEYSEFKANKGTHAQAIRLTSTNFPENIDHKLRRYHKASGKYYEPNEKKFEEYRELVDFFESLDIFEFIGEFSIIVQTPNQEGKLHRDHKFEDLTSEFVWFRGNRVKQFLALNHSNKVPSFVTSYLGFFDDYLAHNTYPVPENSYSVRVTGKFKPHVRQYVAENMQFIKESRREALLQNGEKLLWDQEDCEYMSSKQRNYNNTMTFEDYQKYKQFQEEKEQKLKL